MAQGRIRKGGAKGYQAVSLKDNWRSQWFRNEETAQKHLDDHLEKLAQKDSKKQQARDADETRTDEPLPPGGHNTGPRDTE